MSKFVLLYTGGNEPEEDTTNAWMSWFGSLGSSVVDMGAPFGAAQQVSASGVVAGAPSRASGYSVIETNGVEEALEFAKTCPLIAGGGIVEVHEYVDMG